MRPACEKAEPAQDSGCVGEENKTRYRICDEEDGRKMLNPNLDDTLEYSNGMFGDKLLESDQKGSLNGYGTLDINRSISGLEWQMEISR